MSRYSFIRFNLERQAHRRLQALAKREERPAAHLLRTAVASYLHELEALGAFDEGRP